MKLGLPIATAYTTATKRKVITNSQPKAMPCNVQFAHQDTAGVMNFLLQCANPFLKPFLNLSIASKQLKHAVLTAADIACA